MLTLYSDILYLVAIFVVVAIAAIVGLWQYNAKPETSPVRPIVLADEVRADMMRTRNKAMQEAIEAKRARKVEYRKSIRASRVPVKTDDVAETGPAAGQDSQHTTNPTNPRPANS